jgi:AraC-like DNA-binding protein
MPSTLVRTYSEPDEYAAALRQGRVELTVTRRGTFTARLCNVDLVKLKMQHLEEELPRTSHVDGGSGRAVIVFRTRPGPAVVRNGIELSMDRIVRVPPAQSYFQHTSGPTSHCGMSLPAEEMSDYGVAVVGRDLVQPKDDLTVTPPPRAMARLHRLTKVAVEFAEDAPGVFSHPAAARSYEQSLVEAVVDCLGGGAAGEDRTAVRQHAAIMRRFYRAVERRAGEPLYVPDLCREVGASERTLRACCQEHLGMSPKRYLLLRRMHLVRRALRDSTPAETTVTEIATRYGFWQFGRLAVEYKSLFGEAPSATLAQPAQ